MATDSFLSLRAQIYFLVFLCFFILVRNFTLVLICEKLLCTGEMCTLKGLNNKIKRAKAVSRLDNCFLHNQLFLVFSNNLFFMVFYSAPQIV